MPLTMEHILKQGPKRTVLLEAPDPAEPRVGRVIKRFHAGGLLGGLMDRQRARREFQALKNVRKLGIAAPKPIEVRKGKAHWDLVTEEIPGARDLSQVFANAQLADQPALSLRLATDLAKFLQQLLMGGVQHGDLHPGNVVLDENQQPWLVDMRNVRTGVPNREHDFLDLLLHLCQGCRETTPVGAQYSWLACGDRAWGLPVQVGSKTLTPPQSSPAPGDSDGARDASASRAGSGRAPPQLAASPDGSP